MTPERTGDLPSHRGDPMTTPTSRRGPLIIVSGPSGSGKSTLIRRVLDEGGLPLRLSVSATTRPPRPGEIEGQDYFFWTEEEFNRAVAAHAFVEYAQVHGRSYGTPRSQVEQHLEQGTGVLLDIDYQGARQVKGCYPEVVSIFIRAPSWEEYERRLRARRTETEATLQRRLDTAREELRHVEEYDYVVTNDDLDQAYAEFRALLAEQFETPS
jgi:guanylate kinase